MPKMLDTFSFFVTHPITGLEREVFPVNEDVLIEPQKDDEWEFIIRLTCNTTFLFVDSEKENIDDFSFLYEIETTPTARCEKVPFEIRLRKDNSYYWSGYFRMSAGDFRVSRCELYIKPDIEDQYSCLFDNWEEKVNVLNYGTLGQDQNKVTVSRFAGELVLESETTLSVSSIPPAAYRESDPSGQWTLLKRKVVPFPGPISVFDIWVREVVELDCESGLPPSNPESTLGDGFSLVENNCGTTGTVTYARQVPTRLLSFESYGDNDTEMINQVLGATIVVPGFTSTSGAEITSAEYSNGRPFFQVIAQFIQNYCQKKILSSFFSFNSGNPDTPDNLAYEYAPAHYHDLVLFQTTDITNGDATEDATIATTTFKELLEFCRDTLQSHFIIDGPFFYLEHRSHFEQLSQNGTDLLALHPDRLKGKYSYTYKTEDIPQEQKYTWPTNGNENPVFRGLPIVFKAGCTNGESEDIRIGIINTDLEAAFANPEFPPALSFFLVETGRIGNGQPFFKSSNAVTTGIPSLNAALSWTNLHHYLHRWGKPADMGTLNGEDIEFFSVVRSKAEEPLSIPIAPEAFRDLNFYELMNTNIGWGQIDNGTYNLKSCIFEVNLLH